MKEEKQEYHTVQNVTHLHWRSRKLISKKKVTSICDLHSYAVVIVNLFAILMWTLSYRRLTFNKNVHFLNFCNLKIEYLLL